MTVETEEDKLNKIIQEREEKIKETFLLIGHDFDAICDEVGHEHSE